MVLSDTAVMLDESVQSLQAMQFFVEVLSYGFRAGSSVHLVMLISGTLPYHVQTPDQHRK